MEISITYIWLIAGVLFLLAEALGVTGVGLFFSGMGALTVCMLLSLGLLTAESQMWQFIIFFAATAAWAALLWKPMQRFRVGKQQGGYSNIVGETAYVGSSGLTRQNGEVTWSGTIMKAELARDIATDKLEAGTAVTIVDVSGAKLIVKPKT